MLELLLAVFALGLAALSVIFEARRGEALALAVILLAIIHILAYI